nr:MAG TPA: hypothetical protein [Bacteriophage sp.]
MYGNIVYIYSYVPYVAELFCSEVRTWENR